MSVEEVTIGTELTPDVALDDLVLVDVESGQIDELSVSAEVLVALVDRSDLTSLWFLVTGPSRKSRVRPRVLV